MKGHKFRISWRRVLRKAALILACALAAAGLFLLTRCLINKAFLADYKMEKYAEMPEALLVPIPIGENYVAPYNVGNAKYQNGDYESAAQFFYLALQKEHPDEKDCPIRINLALSLLHGYSFDTMDTKDPEQVEEALGVLYTARAFLTENGCANKESGVFDGHSAEAEKLKRDIDEMIRKLSASGGACSDPDPESKGGGQSGEDSRESESGRDKPETGRTGEEEKKQQSLQQQLKDQKSELESGAFSAGSDYTYVEGSGELSGYGEGSPW